jgi:hypothetical protein
MVRSRGEVGEAAGQIRQPASKQTKAVPPAASRPQLGDRTAGQLRGSQAVANLPELLEGRPYTRPRSSGSDGGSPSA